ncbi:MAG: ATP-dependent Clp protease proteolytic subunit [Ignavibacteriales bacterium]|nr:ATP-dependent Clp protease proteolytic subunit [Ignavibacteriales bacterium]
MPIHVIHFYTSVSYESCNQLKNVCLDAVRQKAPEIHIHLSSGGGSTLYGFTLYNFIKSLPVPVTIHNLGSVESIAMIIFLAAPNRLSCSHSRFLLHSLQWDFTAATSVDHARLREHASALNNDMERYIDIFKERTQGAKEPIDVAACLSGNERFITAADSIKSGITHKVVDATIPKDAINWWVNV